MLYVDQTVRVYTSDRNGNEVRVAFNEWIKEHSVTLCLSVSEAIRLAGLLQDAVAGLPGRVAHCDVCDQPGTPDNPVAGPSDCCGIETYCHTETCHEDF